MKQFSAQFKKQSDSIRMRASERRELHARVVSYMEYHPLPKEMKQEVFAKVAKLKGIPSEAFFAIPFNKIYVRSFSGVFAVLCIFAVPLIAEQALPGDVLYPVKVQFTEELRSTLSFSPYAKVAWETERLERRISEARLLASEGKLTPEAQLQFADAVKNHADAAQREIAVLRESDSDEAAIAEIAFASALAVQSEVLAGHLQNEPSETLEEGTAILAVAEVVAQARSSAAVSQNNVPPSYEKLLARVELESTHVYELFSSVKEEASSEEVFDVERRLADIERKMKQAIALKEGTPVEDDAGVASVVALMSQPATDDASMSLMTIATNVASGTEEVIANEAVAKEVSDEIATVELVNPEDAEAQAVEQLRLTLTDIQKLINYLTNIDVRENVSIESLVPVTLTAQERAMQIKELFDKTQQLQTEIEQKEISSKLQGKVSRGQREVEGKLKRVTGAMERGNLDSARGLVEEAHALALDLITIVSQEPQKEVVEDVEETVDTRATTTEAVTE